MENHEAFLKSLKTQASNLCAIGSLPTSESFRGFQDWLKYRLNHLNEAGEHQYDVLDSLINDVGVTAQQLSTLVEEFTALSDGQIVAFDVNLDVPGSEYLRIWTGEAYQDLRLLANESGNYIVAESDQIKDKLGDLRDYLGDQTEEAAGYLEYVRCIMSSISDDAKISQELITTGVTSASSSIQEVATLLACTPEDSRLAALLSYLQESTAKVADNVSTAQLADEDAGSFVPADFRQWKTVGFAAGAWSIMSQAGTAIGTILLTVGTPVIKVIGGILVGLGMAVSTISDAVDSTEHVTILKSLNNSFGNALILANGGDWDVTHWGSAQQGLPLNVEQSESISTRWSQELGQDGGSFKQRGLLYPCANFLGYRDQKDFLAGISDYFSLNGDTLFIHPNWALIYKSGDVTECTQLRELFTNGYCHLQYVDNPQQGILAGAFYRSVSYWNGCRGRSDCVFNYLDGAEDDTDLDDRVLFYVFSNIFNYCFEYGLQSFRASRFNDQNLRSNLDGFNIIGSDGTFSILDNINCSRPGATGWEVLTPFEFCSQILRGLNPYGRVNGGVIEKSNADAYALVQSYMQSGHIAALKKAFCFANDKAFDSWLDGGDASWFGLCVLFQYALDDMFFSSGTYLTPYHSNIIYDTVVNFETLSKLMGGEFGPRADNFSYFEETQSSDVIDRILYEYLNSSDERFATICKSISPAFFLSIGIALCMRILFQCWKLVTGYVDETYSSTTILMDGLSSAFVMTTSIILTEPDIIPDPSEYDYNVRFWKITRMQSPWYCYNDSPRLIEYPLVKPPLFRRGSLLATAVLTAAVIAAVTAASIAIKVKLRNRQKVQVVRKEQAALDAEKRLREVDPKDTDAYQAAQSAYIKAQRKFQRYANKIGYSSNSMGSFTTAGPANILSSVSDMSSSPLANAGDNISALGSAFSVSSIDDVIKLIR